MADPETDSSPSVACEVDDVPEGGTHVVEIDGEQVAIFNVDGEFTALNNTCPHQGGPLGQGKVEDDCVYCPWHGWQFDLGDGSHVQGIADATAYDVTVEDGTVYVELGSR